MLPRRAIVVAATVSALTAGGVALVGTTAASPPAPSSEQGPLTTAPANAGANSAPRSPATAAKATAPAIVCPDVAGSSTASRGVGSAAHLFTRTTAGGVTIRAYRFGAGTVSGCGPIPAPGAGMLPAFACDGGAVTLEMSDDAVVGVGTVGAWAVPMETPSTSTTTTDPSGTLDPEQLSSGTFGVGEGAPVWWVAVEVASDVAHAQVTFADGTTDDMVPVDGIVALAAPVTADARTNSDPYTVRATVTFSDASGRVLSTQTLPLPTPTPAPTPAPVPLPMPVTPSTPSPIPAVTTMTAPAGAGAPSTGTGSTTPNTTTDSGASPDPAP